MEYKYVNVNAIGDRTVIDRKSGKVKGVWGDFTLGGEYNTVVKVCDVNRVVVVRHYLKPIKWGYEKKVSTPNYVRELVRLEGETDDEFNVREYLHKKNVFEQEEKRYVENKRRNVRKSGRRVQELIEYNKKAWFKPNGKLYPITMLTLTFKENVKDWGVANTKFKNFIKRLNYYVNGCKKNTLAYIAVPEIQERGAIHYHIMFFNLPYVDCKEVEELWGEGYTKVEVEKGNKGNGEGIGKYLTDYMLKEFYRVEEEFEYNKEVWRDKKVYFASRNLVRPSIVKLDIKNRKAFDILSHIVDDVEDREKGEKLSLADDFEGYIGEDLESYGFVNKVETVLSDYGAGTSFETILESLRLLVGTSMGIVYKKARLICNLSTEENSKGWLERLRERNKRKRKKWRGKEVRVMDLGRRNECKYAFELVSVGRDWGDI